MLTVFDMILIEADAERKRRQRLAQEMRARDQWDFARRVEAAPPIVRLKYERKPINEREEA